MYRFVTSTNFSSFTSTIFLRMHQKAAVIADLQQIYQTAVDAVKPETIFQRDKCLELINNQLIVRANGNAKHFDVAGKNIHVIGFGKAVYGLAVQVEKVLHDRLISGIISVPVGTGREQKLKKIEVHEGAKDNLPDSEAFETTKKIVERCTKLNENDVLICLISGGGSALLPYPKGSLTLTEKTTIIKTLANRGASIEELNTVRIGLSEVKGGRLAEKAKNAHLIISLIISDIIGDPLHLIASGPTVVQNDDSTNAISILKKYKINDPKITGKLKTECPALH